MVFGKLQKTNSGQKDIHLPVIRVQKLVNRAIAGTYTYAFFLNNIFHKNIVAEVSDAEVSFFVFFQNVFLQVEYL